MAWNPLLKKSFYVVAAGAWTWALFLVLLLNPWFQRHALYAHTIHSGFWHNVSNPEEFGFAKGQVQPFTLKTADGESLFCWHVLPLDVYLEHENEIVQKTTGLVEDLKETVGYRILKKDEGSKVVINFHGNAGHVAQGHRPSTYRSISSIPHTHLLTCDYRGFGKSTLLKAPNIPTESGLITDGISLINYILADLGHPSSRTVLLGQSLGTAVTTASALYFTDPESTLLPTDITPPQDAVQSKGGFAGIVLVSPFPSLPVLLETYRIFGILPILSPLRGYPKIAKFVNARIVDRWPTLERLTALLAPSGKGDSRGGSGCDGVRLTLLHARNDQDIDFRLSEDIYATLESQILSSSSSSESHSHSSVLEERRSIHGGERVKRGAFAYRRVEDAESTKNDGGGKSVELEIVRYGGHNEVVGFAQVSLAVRRAFREAEAEAEEGKARFRVGLDVE
ncbi:Alpha/Beta hydrolase protein [Lophiotrema nucula]|uniref:Alpha/Beta hydrolase protein n=1 Tax=Lophiotrema nucula TaxID=690887 RepID=A0A6A5YEH4_9PLEO|nr:Alpha/Beta hydrolase protein [Lophiotrema nucula]